MKAPQAVDYLEALTYDFEDFLFWLCCLDDGETFNAERFFLLMEYYEILYIIDEFKKDNIDIGNYSTEWTEKYNTFKNKMSIPNRVTYHK